jgi:hypothetical protein
VGSAVFIPLLGPFAPPILILLFPLVFRRGSNVTVEHLLTGFGIAWLGVMALSLRSWIPALEGSIASIAIGIGVVPLLAALILTRRRAGRRDSRRPT